MLLYWTMYGYCPLASSSKGNCVYLGTKEVKLLIDCGLSAKRTSLELAALGVQLDEIDAIIVSHEHSDHIRGIRTLAFRHGIPILANSETAKGIVEDLGRCPSFKIFTGGEPFSFGDVEIRSFSVSHDSLDPVMFTFHFDGIKFGLCTDLGFVTPVVRNHLRDCDYLYVEANHEPSFVHASARPVIYKKRVLGRSGHLSNEECGQLLNDVAHSNLKHVYLAHLSGECNNEEVAFDKVMESLARQGHTVDLAVAARDTRSPAIFFGGNSAENLSHRNGESVPV